MTRLLLIFTFFFICMSGFSAHAQNPLSREVQTEFGIGLASPILHSGKELMRSKELRDQGLSYYQNSSGTRAKVGSYNNPIGWVLTTAYFRPVKKINGLMLGTAFRAALTGTSPSNGGYAEGYFFNFFNVTGAAKYYPFNASNLFFRAEAGMASVLTKNRFVDENGEQNFFHQFGIGTNTSFAVGYSTKPFKNSRKVLDIQALYQLNNTRVEVNGIGNDKWLFSGLNLIASINF